MGNDLEVYGHILVKVVFWLTSLDGLRVNRDSSQSGLEYIQF
jgi:hypothetical protein